MKSKAPKKSKLQKRIEDVSSTYWLSRADDAWSDLIHTVYQGCAVNKDCSGPLEAHHIVNRARRATRHNPWAGILLCSTHHQWSVGLSAHIASLAFAEWLQINRPRQWAWACEHKFDPNPDKLDYKVAMERLVKLKEDYISKESLRAKQ